MKYLLKHGHLVIDEKTEYLDGSILIENETIKNVYQQSDLIDEEGLEVIDLKSNLVFPGFFDTHTHGGMNHSFDDCNEKEMDEIDELYAREGSTSYLTSISYDLSPEQFKERLNFFDKYNGKSARFVGVHLEGPYLNPNQLGMGSAEKFLKPDINFIKSFLATTDKIKQVTLAVEREGAKEIAKLLHESGIKVMVGHSDALWKDIDENCDGFTHLFNAMRGFHHRDLTLVNAALSNKYKFEIINDGRHVNTEVLKHVYKNVDKKNIIAITDSSSGRGLPDGDYMFLSKKCTKKGMDFMTEDGHYAGSVASLRDEMELLYGLGLTYPELLSVTSLNAYKFYGLDDKFGTIEKGKIADLVIMDSNFKIQNVYCKGKFVL